MRGKYITSVSTSVDNVLPVSITGNIEDNNTNELSVIISYKNQILIINKLNKRSYMIISIDEQIHLVQ